MKTEMATMPKAMKQFDCVKFMRKVREDLSKRYAGKPDLERRELKAARKRFEDRIGKVGKASGKRCRSITLVTKPEGAD